MDNSQLFIKHNNESKDIFPITYLENIIDSKTKESLEIILSKNNHIYISTIGDKGTARLAVPNLFRREGLVISYKDENSNLITEKYIGKNTLITDKTWTEDNNWKHEITENDIINSIPTNSISLKQLSQEVLDLIGNNSNLNIVNYPDNEDLESIVLTGNVKQLQFKDRPVTPINKGYKILRKNKQMILTQDMINQSNTIYEIRYDFDLNGTTIDIPENCVLKFEGGSLNNGIIILNNTKIFPIGCIITDYITAVIKGIYKKGQFLFDSIINKMILWNGTNWINFDGTELIVEDNKE